MDTTIVQANFQAFGLHKMILNPLFLPTQATAIKTFKLGHDRISIESAITPQA
jgi:hypothetical protein